MVDDDDGDGFPSPEPRTDSKSALLRKIRAWPRLYIIKRDESFFPIFLPEREYIELELRLVEPQEAHEVGGALAMGTIPYGDTYKIPIPIYSLSSHPHRRLHDWG